MSLLGGENPGGPWYQGSGAFGILAPRYNWIPVWFAQDTLSKGEMAQALDGLIEESSLVRHYQHVLAVVPPLSKPRPRMRRRPLTSIEQPFNAYVKVKGIPNKAPRRRCMPPSKPTGSESSYKT